MRIWILMGWAWGCPCPKHKPSVTLPLVELQDHQYNATIHTVVNKQLNSLQFDLAGW